MIKKAIILSVVSMISVGAFTMTSNASDQGVNYQPKVNETSVDNDTYSKPRDNCKGKVELTEDQKALLEKGYNELTQAEKDTLETYKTTGKRNLSEEQLKELYAIQDKVHKYMDDNFKQKVQERREQRKLRIENKDNNGQGLKKGNRQGNGACQQ